MSWFSDGLQKLTTMWSGQSRFYQVAQDIPLVDYDTLLQEVQRIVSEAEDIFIRAKILPEQNNLFEVSGSQNTDTVRVTALTGYNRTSASAHSKIFANSKISAYIKICADLRHLEITMTDVREPSNGNKIYTEWWTNFCDDNVFERKDKITTFLPQDRFIDFLVLSACQNYPKGIMKARNLLKEALQNGSAQETLPAYKPDDLV